MSSVPGCCITYQSWVTLRIPSRPCGTRSNMTSHGFTLPRFLPYYCHPASNDQGEELSKNGFRDTT